MAEAAGVVRPRRPRPGIIDLYLARSMVAPFLLVALGACTAMMMERALRLIHELAAGGADVGFLLPILAQLLPYYLNLALPAGFFVALAIVIARLDDRLELQAMLAVGCSLLRITAPLIGIGLVVAAASIMVGGWLEPYGRYGFRAARAAAMNAGRMVRLQPKGFYRPAEGLSLTFDESRSDGTVGEVFLWERTAPDREMIVTAQTARIALGRDNKTMVFSLELGRLVEESPKSNLPALQTVNFGRMSLQAPLLVNEEVWRRGWDQKEMTLTELAAEARSRSPRLARNVLEAELYNRLARALSIPLLPLLVVPLAFTVKTGRRGASILVGGILFAALHHSLNLAKNLGVAGSLDPALALGAVALPFTLLVIAIFHSSCRLPSHSPIASLLARVTRPISLDRAGRIVVPAGVSATFAVYITVTLARHILLAGAAIVLILQMVDIFDRGDEFVRRGMGFADIGYYALVRLPPIVQQAIPLAALAGAMSAFIVLRTRWEIIALRAAGVSQFRMLRMAIPLFLCLSLAGSLISEWAAPASELRFAAWWRATAVRERPRDVEPRWFRIERDIVRATKASPDGRELSDLTIYRRDGRGLIVNRIKASRAVEGENGWMLYQVELTGFTTPGEAPLKRERIGWRTALRPGDVQSFFAAGPQITVGAARRAIDFVAPVDRGTSYFKTRLLRAWVEPLAPWVMLLLALPLAFVGGRTGAAWPSVLYAVFGGLSYLVIDGVLTVMAQVGALPPMVGAFTAPVLGLLISCWVLLLIER